MFRQITAGDDEEQHSVFPQFCLSGVQECGSIKSVFKINVFREETLNPPLSSRWISWSSIDTEKSQLTAGAMTSERTHVFTTALREKKPIQFLTLNWFISIDCVSVEEYGRLLEPCVKTRIGYKALRIFNSEFFFFFGWKCEKKKVLTSNSESLKSKSKLKFEHQIIMFFNKMVSYFLSNQQTWLNLAFMGPTIIPPNPPFICGPA